MDFYGLEDYAKGEHSLEANSDSQVILDDTDEHLMMCEMEQEKLSQTPILMESSQGSTSHVSKAANLPDSLDKTEEQETDDTDIADIEFDINQKLQKLNSLFKAKSAKEVAGKQKMPTIVMKGKGQKGHYLFANQSKQNRTTPSGLSFTRTVQVGNKTVQTSTVSTIPTGQCSLESNRNNSATELVPAPLGRRRSDRLVDKSLVASTQGASEPQSSIVPRQTTNDEIQVINLVNAPPLVLPGVINLDSDEEDHRKNSERNDKLSDLSFEENYELLIKIRWNGKIQKYPLRKHQRFGEIIEKLAQEENVDANQIIMSVGESTIVRAEDTPESINYNISMILHGRIITSDAIAQPKGNKKARRDKNMIKVRLQADGLKNPVEIFIDKTRKFSSIRHTIAEALNIDSARLKLKFDGELIELDETPIDLDFDGGEMIDCVTAK